MTRTHPFVATQCAIVAHLSLVAPAAGAAVTFHSTPDSFEAAIIAAGTPLVSFEDFEDGNAPPNTGTGITDPLDACSSNSVFALGEIAPGLRLQSNTNGTPDVNDPGTSGENPAGSSGLVALGPSDVIADIAIGATTFGFGFNSLDVICLDDRYTAMQLRIADAFPPGAGAMEVRVYDFDTNALLGTTTIDSAVAGGTFLGIVAEPPCSIGRVNLWGPGQFACCGGDEVVYEVGLHAAEAPCAADVNGDGEVGINDLLHLLSVWGTAGPPDPSGDGTVDIVDLLLMLGSWGECVGGRG